MDIDRSAPSPGLLSQPREFSVCPLCYKNWSFVRVPANELAAHCRLLPKAASTALLSRATRARALTDTAGTEGVLRNRLASIDTLGKEVLVWWADRRRNSATDQNICFAQA
jgi:hypothetical protein